MEMPQSAPPPIHQLWTWCEQQGFRQDTGSFGDVFNLDVHLTDGLRTIHINSTRGSWSLGIGLAGWRADHTVGEWRAQFEHRELEVNPTPILRDEVAFITGEWPRLASEAAGLAGIESEMDGRSTAAVSRWLARERPTASCQTEGAEHVE
jgi:hypothetical protein